MTMLSKRFADLVGVRILTVSQLRIDDNVISPSQLISRLVVQSR